jgi:hypothetical protein
MFQMSPRTARLIDARDPRLLVERANIAIGLNVTALGDIETSWSSARASAATAALLEHGHWDWRNKSQTVKAGRHDIVAIVNQGGYQGAMAILSHPQKGRLSPSEVLYVDYVEIAPWNLKTFGSPMYFGVIAVGGCVHQP